MDRRTILSLSTNNTVLVSTIFYLQFIVCPLKPYCALYCLGVLSIKKASAYCSNIVSVQFRRKKTGTFTNMASIRTYLKRQRLNIVSAINLMVYCTNFIDRFWSYTKTYYLQDEEFYYNDILHFDMVKRMCSIIFWIYFFALLEVFFPKILEIFSISFAKSIGLVT